MKHGHEIQDRHGRERRPSQGGVPKQPGASDQPTDRSRGGGVPTGPAAPMAPGDEAPQGEPGTGENTCPRCDGSGLQGTRPCPECGGRGVVTVNIGGA